MKKLFSLFAIVTLLLTSMTVYAPAQGITYVAKPISTFTSYIGSVNSGQIGTKFTPMANIVVRKIEIHSTATATCTVSAVVRTQYSTPNVTIADVTLTDTAGPGDWSSPALFVVVPAGKTINAFAQTNGTCTSSPANVTVVVQYQTQ